MILAERGYRLRPTETTDGWGSASEDWENASRVEMRCYRQQLSSAEVTDANDTTLTRYRLFLAAKADITATDRWEQDGITCRIVGQPDRPGGPLGEHHVEVVIEEVSP